MGPTLAGIGKALFQYVVGVATQGKQIDPQRLLQGVWLAISTLWGYLNQFFVGQWNGFAQLFDGLGVWSQAVNTALSRTATGFWIVTSRVVPRAANWSRQSAITQSERYSNRITHDQVKTEQQRRIANDRSLLRRALSLAGLVLRVDASAARALGWIANWGRLVTTLLSDARRLASWAAPEMINALIRYLLTHGGGVIAWTIRKTFGDARNFAHLLEDVIHDVM